MLRLFEKPADVSAARVTMAEPAWRAGGLVSEDWLQSRLAHPYLRNDDRRRAFLDLVSCPGGTYRGWAKQWNWTLPRVQRFIATLAKQRIVTSVRTAWGTLVEVRYATDTEPIQRADTTSIHPMRTRNTCPIPLGSKTGKQLNLETRTTDSKTRSVDSDNYTTVLIDSMNAIFSQRFGAEYRPVMHDNRRSAEAINRLKTAGVPLPFARNALEQNCRLFNPYKHGRGNLPGTLGYFEKGIIKAFTARDRSGDSPALNTPPDQAGNAPRGGKPENLLRLVDIVVDRCVAPIE